MANNFIANQPQAFNPFGNRNPFQNPDLRLNPNLIDTGLRGDGYGSNPSGSRGASSGNSAAGYPVQGPAYNGNFDPNTGWGVPGRGLPGRPGEVGRFGGGVNDMSAYNPAYDPSAQFGGMGGARSGKGGGGVGGYGGGQGGAWWDNPAVQGMSDQTRALAPLYAQSTGAPGYLQKVIGRRFNPADPNANTQGQGLW